MNRCAGGEDGADLPAMNGAGLWTSRMSHWRSRQGGTRSPTALHRLFVTSADHDGCTLVAVARNGDQYRYSYLGGLTSGLCYNTLMLRSYTPARLAAPREVSVCMATSSMVLLAHAETDVDSAAAKEGAAAGAVRTISPPRPHAVPISSPP